MSRYTHIFSGQESEAVAGLPDLSLPSKQSQKAIATGTDDLVLDSAYKPAYKKLAKNAYFDGQSLSSIGSAGSGQDSNAGDINGIDNTLQMTDLGIKKDLMSSTDGDSKMTTVGWTIIELLYLPNRLILTYL